MSLFENPTGYKKPSLFVQGSGQNMEEEEDEEEEEYDDWLESQLRLKRATVSEALTPHIDTIDNAISYAWEELTQTTSWMAHNASSIESQLCEAALEAEQHQSKYHTITSSPKKIERLTTEITGANSSRNKIGDAYLSLPVRDRNEIAQAVKGIVEAVAAASTATTTAAVDTEVLRQTDSVYKSMMPSIINGFESVKDTNAMSNKVSEEVAVEAIAPSPSSSSKAIEETPHKLLDAYECDLALPAESFQPVNRFNSNEKRYCYRWGVGTHANEVSKLKSFDE